MVQDAIDAGQLDLGDVPANAFAALLLALADGLMLHNAIDPTGFRWQNIARVLDEVLAAVGPGERARGAADDGSAAGGEGELKAGSQAAVTSLTSTRARRAAPARRRAG